MAIHDDKYHIWLQIHPGWGLSEGFSKKVGVMTLERALKVFWHFAENHHHSRILAVHGRMVRSGSSQFPAELVLIDRSWETLAEPILVW